LFAGIPRHSSGLARLRFWTLQDGHEPKNNPVDGGAGVTVHFIHRPALEPVEKQPLDERDARKETRAANAGRTGR